LSSSSSSTELFGEKGEAELHPLPATTHNVSHTILSPTWVLTLQRWQALVELLACLSTWPCACKPAHTCAAGPKLLPLLTRVQLALRVHDACFTSEVLGSLKCDCKEQLQLAMEYIQDNPPGMVIYLQQEGRGIGLANKIAAYALQVGFGATRWACAGSTSAVGWLGWLLHLGVLWWKIGLIWCGRGTGCGIMWRGM
jgi:GTP cyclohydrolase II